MWSDLSRPSVIAHRGDRSHAPENTLSAFKLAADKGADAIEFDVKLSADQQVIVIHDQTVDRTTDGKGNVARLPLAAMREFNANVQFPGQPSEKIPTLDELFAEVGNRLYMNVELTNYATPSDDLVTRVVELVHRHSLEKRVLFSSFFPRNLAIAHSLLPEVPCALLTWSGLIGWWGRNIGWRKGFYFALHPYFTDVDAGFADRVHAAGKRINVWTVNSEADIKRMVGLGVDGIITDDPALALRLLGRSK